MPLGGGNETDDVALERALAVEIVDELDASESVALWVRASMSASDRFLSGRIGDAGEDSGPE